MHCEEKGDIRRCRSKLLLLKLEIFQKTDSISSVLLHLIGWFKQQVGCFRLRWKKAAYFQMALVIGASRMSVFGKDVVVDIFYCWNVFVAILSFMTHDLKTWVYCSDFLRDTFPVALWYYVCRFALSGTWRALNVPCMLWAQCMPTRGRAMWNEGNQMFWSTLRFWFIMLQQCCMSNCNMIVSHICATVALYCWVIWPDVIYLIFGGWSKLARQKVHAWKLFRTTMEGRLRLILTYNLNLYNLYLCRMYVTVMQMLLCSFLLPSQQR